VVNINITKRLFWQREMKDSNWNFNQAQPLIAQIIKMGANSIQSQHTMPIKMLNSMAFIHSIVCLFQIILKITGKITEQCQNRWLVITLSAVKSDESSQS